ncbi:diguanylate cyclase (GGDEF) domain-containing protein [Duganella sp. CF517]|uniref:diguanylate cyclase domain-containing protein n=1 Tax=Duganella sp. CF517 TaxID=1881038 RepID=UPI0008CF655E|nr:diguanylate cyclase [Duganella sp. CF517]SEO09296.1 diguanylate cyclase (GGDEF) domain-containing protein [Duganella sp. CF517]
MPITLLHTSDRTKIDVAAGAGGERIVSKEALGSDAVERARHERDMLARLEGVDGVPQLAGAAHAPQVVALREHGGVPLAQLLRHERLAVPDVLALALALARIVAAVHARGVVHHDIHPGHILLSGPRRVPILIDFQLATAGSAGMRAGAAGQMLGTLAYAAPEQISGGSRAVDHRADLYALGATVYELATGAPPFQQADIARLAQDQLNRVPAPPASLAPGLPAPLSAIIMRLLEKEPDRRYQSAEGLAHDLARLAGGAHGDFELGARDFPARLAAPARLVGRARELQTLMRAFERAMRGAGRGVLLSGAPGVGKQRLVAQLQPLVAARGGYFVAGKFHQLRHDRQSDGVYLAFRALGRRLLAEPEHRLAEMRARIHDALGVNAALMAASSPEFAIILGVPAEPWNDTTADATNRLLTGVTTLLRAIVTPQRPLVMAIDDLQWAHPFSLAILDTIMRDANLPGLLLVLAWRGGDLPPGHPLAALLLAWAGHGAQRLELDNLPAADVALLLEQVLRLPPRRAADLAAALAEHTGGNPYDTIELLNALRQSGVLRLDDGGWAWDQDALKRHVGRGGAASLLLARIDRLPPDSARLLRAMACLGGDVRLDQLAAATGLAAETVDVLLAPALDDGLLAREADGGGAPLARFRHDRVQQAVYGALAPAERPGRHLAIARRLEPLPDQVALAAAQYLAAAPLIEPHERTRVIALFRHAAHLSRQSNDAECERLLRAALDLLGEPADAAARRLRNEMLCERHAALVRVGRAGDADALYAAMDATIDAGAAAPLELIPAACLQMSALMLRRQLAEAVALGMRMLDRLGFPLARFDGAAAIAAELDAFGAWLERQDAHGVGASAHAETADARIGAVAMVFERCVRAAFFIDDALLAGLSLGAWRLWRDHGLCAPMVAPVSFIGIVAIRQRDDYRLGYDASRFLLRLCEERGYVLEGERVRALFSVSHAHWREPLEHCLAHARQAHAALMQGGDLLAACLPLIAVVSCTLESAPTLAAGVAEARAALDVAARANNLVAAPAFRAVLALSRALHDGHDALEAEDPAHFTPLGRCNWHIAQAIKSALMDEPGLLDEHSGAAFAARDVLYGGYSKVLVTLLRALSLARQAQDGDGARRAALLAAIAPLRDELARWAVDAPDNVRHLMLWLDAERARANDDFIGAARAYDDALAALDARQRPWHRALIGERAGLFHLAHAMPRTGRQLLAEARRHYQAWGAAAKVARLEREHGFLRSAAGSLAADVDGRARVSTDSLHMLALLRASQALSSETSLARLHARVAEQLGAMTGAGEVRLLLPREDGDGWALAGAEPGAGAGEAPGVAAGAGVLPLSAIRYVVRTRAALVVDDATGDERFAADPYWRGMRLCSLLLLPVMNRGELRAILMLENRQRRGAFAADRLETVELIAGQLAVSLDNAMLYASLERKVAERTRALELANRELAALSVTDALTGLANRRHFDQALGTEWRRARRAGTPLGAAMIDIDQFKPYNDLYGHQQGDACLRLVAEALAHSVRQGVDLVARYGGEEFAIILPGADLAETAAVAERARAAVAALAAPHQRSAHGIVTVSIGVAALAPPADLDADGLYRAADAALYQAKESGRNRVVRAPARPPPPATDF